MSASSSSFARRAAAVLCEERVTRTAAEDYNLAWLEMAHSLVVADIRLCNLARWNGLNSYCASQAYAGASLTAPRAWLIAVAKHAIVLSLFCPYHLNFTRTLRVHTNNSILVCRRLRTFDWFTYLLTVESVPVFWSFLVIRLKVLIKFYYFWFP